MTAFNLDDLRLMAESPRLAEDDRKVALAAIKEIEQLRAIAGVVDALYSFREMKQEIKNGPSVS